MRPMASLPPPPQDLPTNLYDSPRREPDLRPRQSAEPMRRAALTPPAPIYQPPPMRPYVDPAPAQRMTPVYAEPAPRPMPPVETMRRQPVQTAVAPPPKPGPAAPAPIQVAARPPAADLAPRRTPPAAAQAQPRPGAPQSFAGADFDLPRQAPAKPVRTAAVAPRTPIAAPVVRPPAPAPTPASSVGRQAPRLYSLHREYGLSPDAIPAPPKGDNYVLIGPADEPKPDKDESDKDDATP